ncbi:hypothetical protein GRJ2_002183400 [Grus japonensis]|uniref:Uncharacterized protein n=1 Tax=Grus japonensis TaxID=30415 RepID=A0ABC9XIJ1_GRUJA
MFRLFLLKKFALGTGRAQKTALGEGATGLMEPELLDLPLGVKIPVVPGSKPVFSRAKLGEKLHRPSGYFDLGDPYCRLTSTEYNSLHDPHLQAYYKRKDNLRRLKKEGYVTSDGKVVCTLKEFNEYRQYLTRLKLEAEKMARQEKHPLGKGGLQSHKETSQRVDGRAQKTALGEGATGLMEPELLDLPLGVKIPVVPGSKPVFSRAKLGEKQPPCTGRAQKTALGEGATGLMEPELLDLPLGVKIPVVPGSKPVFSRAKLGEKLHRPSGYFDLGDPYCRLTSTEYNSLHDPHLQAYYKRKDNLRRLKKEGYVTSDGKVVCTLKEFNEYRQYLTRLKLEAEKMARQEKADALLSRAQKTALGEGATGLMEPELLDLPLGVKIPVVPGSKPVFSRAKLGEKLHRPSGYFDLGDPYCRLTSTEYNSLHDPHLQAYYKRKDNLRRLKKEGYVTSDGKVVCTLKEFNEYRQYLTRLKLEAEKMARQEKLHRPSGYFDLGDPYCRLTSTEYNSLHDPHLQAYYKRKDNLRRLKKEGYVTSDGKVVCTLKEFNEYRQYLTRLKLEAEKMARQEKADALLSRAQKTALGEGATGLMEPELLDLPLGVKIPVVPGSKPVFSRAKLGEKLHRPSGYFDLGDPYCRLTSTEYNSLHDPHLQAYYKRKDNLRRLKKEGYVTSDGKVVCTLKEFNEYRQYLTRLKLEAEKMARQEKADALLSRAQKTALGEGATGLMEPELLDLPLGVKIPVVPGSKPVFSRAKLGEKLHRPSGYFDLGDPYCRLTSTEYNSLHDPHLQAYYKRKDNLRRLKKEGYVTSDGKVVCTLKEFNEYRQYLTRLKLEAEKMARQEKADALLSRAQKTALGEGATGLMEPELLDLPLGVKIPVVPGSKPVFSRAKLGEKLHRPSGYFDLGDPYCRLTSTEYNSLHDPHLQAYYKRKDNLRRLKKEGYVTSDGKVVCTLKEFNEYRQYLTRLKLEAEKMARQEKADALLSRAQKTALGEGATGLMEPELLDLPLGVKIPVVPGSKPVFSRAKLGEKLHRPSGYFDLGDPYCRLTSTEYNSLHDPHLQAYYKRKDNLRRLKKEGYVTSDGKVVCTLKEFNEYRQYLTRLKLEAEKMARQEKADALLSRAQKTALGEGATGLMEPELLDLPLGVKIPVVPGSKPVFSRAKLGEKLHRPSGYFDLGDPYCRLTSTEYNSLHDPHLQAYYKRKDNLRRLKKEGYVTSDGKVVCTLKEFNEYRQYLTRLKLEAEKMARQEKADALLSRAQKTALGEGATGLMEPELLDLPLGVKIPVVPGSKPVFSRAKLGEKLHRPSGYFDLGDPYCRLTSTEYNSLHDPHLQAYYKRKDNLRRLKKEGYVTSDGKVVCTLKEFNEYRQYLTRLKLEAEKMARQEKLHRPSGYFDLGDPYCRLTSTEYNSLHDPHLQAYYKRKDNLRRLKKEGYVTSDGKVVCTLKEFNEYRQYLTRLKLEAEKMARQEKVGKAECWRTPVSGTVPRAGA